MSVDFVSAFRSELRGAALRQTAIRRRHRRMSLLLAVGVGAILLVGGAIAAQTHWLGTSSSGDIEIRTAHEQFDHLTKGFRACMAAHGAHPVKVRGGGWTFRNAAAAETACGAYAATITLTCRPLQLPPGQPAQTKSMRCASVAHMTVGQPLRLGQHK
jgi:hypothetical protein